MGFSAPTCQISRLSGYVSLLGCKKTHFGPLSKNNTGMAALRASLPVIVTTTSNNNNGRKRKRGGGGGGGRRRRKRRRKKTESVGEVDDKEEAEIKKSVTYLRFHCLLHLLTIFTSSLELYVNTTNTLESYVTSNMEEKYKKISYYKHIFLLHKTRNKRRKQV